MRELIVQIVRFITMLNVPPMKSYKFSTVHNNVEMEVTSCEWLQIQDDNVYCDGIFLNLSHEGTNGTICSEDFVGK